MLKSKMIKDKQNIKICQFSQKKHIKVNQKKSSVFIALMGVYACLTEYASAACTPTNAVRYVADVGSTCTFTDANTGSGTLNNTFGPAIYATGGSTLGVAVTAPLAINQNVSSGPAIQASGASQINFTGGQKVSINVLRIRQYGIEVDDTSSMSFDHDVEIKFTTSGSGTTANRSIYMTGGTLGIAGHLSISDTTNVAAAGVSISGGAHLNLNTAAIVMGQIGSGLRFEGAAAGNSQIYSTGLVDISTTGGGDYSAAIRGNNQGVMNLDSLKTHGTNGSYGISITSDNAEIIIRNNAEIVTEGNSGIGIAILGVGKFSSGSGSVVTNGDNATGFFESNASSSGIDRNLTLDVNTYGATAHAVQLNATAGDVVFTTNKILSTDQASSNALDITAAAGKNATVDFKGTINSSGIGININQANAATITNDQNASITAINGNTGIDVHNVLVSSTINNYGDITVDSGALAIFGGSAADTVNIFSGDITGDIQLGTGHDVFNASGGRIKGSVYLGDGNDIATLSGSVDLSDMPRIDGGSGIDSLTIKGLNLSGYTAGSNDVSKGVNLTNWNTLLLIDGAVFTQNANLFDATKTSTLLIDDSAKWQVAAAPSVNTVKITGSVQNSGQMNLANNGITGDVLTITGNYQGNDGLISFDTRLDGDHSSTDKLIVQGDTSGQSLVQVHHRAGSGAQTIEGIELIEVQGQSDGVFKLNNRVVAGAYEYLLERGAVTNGTDSDNWYLTSVMTKRSGGGGDEHYISPESGAYIGLLEHNAAAFNHSFHDRQQLLDNQYQSSWARVEYTQTESLAANGQLKNTTDKTLLHFGSDIVQTDKAHLGVMAAYANGDIDTHAQFLDSYAKAKSEGYSVGVYGTWFNQDKNSGGAYIDAYAQYNWFRNKTNGEGFPEEHFDSEGVTLSAEAGYGFVLGQGADKTWTVEPQVQLIYNNANGKNHLQQNGIEVNMGNTNDLISRVGVRLQGRGEGFEPFVTLNYWLHSDAASVQMGGTDVNTDRAKNLFEAKLGGQIAIQKNLELFGQVGGIWGENSTSAYGGNIGLKFMW